MKKFAHNPFFILGLSIFTGLSMLGFFIKQTAVSIKEYERTIVVKGLSEQEFSANTVIWPITFTASSNQLNTLYEELDKNSERIMNFLKQQNIQKEEITVAAAEITDKEARTYSDPNPSKIRYLAQQTFTVYSHSVNAVRKAMQAIASLGKTGIIFSNDNYRSKTQYLFTGLSEVKPQMIEQATRNARRVAQKFAEDSDSHLGKIRKASQGQFSVSPRDSSSPHIKKVRVVSTVEYYLAD